MTNLEFAQAWTRKLEALGVVLNNAVVLTNPEKHLRSFILNVGAKMEDRPLHPHPSRGRKKLHASGYARLKAHRRKKSGIRIKVTDDNEIGL
jgi:hypothetical protein